MIGGAGMRDCEAADYSREASACESQELGGLKPPWFRRPCVSTTRAKYSIHLCVHACVR